MSWGRNPNFIYVLLGWDGDPFPITIGFYSRSHNAKRRIKTLGLCKWNIFEIVAVSK